MPILVMCTNPECGEIFDAPDDDAGAEVACPACGAVQTLPGEPVAGGFAPAPTPPTAEAKAPEPLAPPAPPKASAREDEDALEFMTAAGGQRADEGRFTRSVAKPPEAPADSGRPPDARADPRLDRPPESEAYHTADEMPVQLDEEWEELFSLPATDAQPEAAAAEPTDQGVLEHRPAAAAVFLLGLVGMAGGVVAALSWSPVQPVLAAYLGAGAGWVGGFVLGLLMVLAVERPESGKVRCGVCHNLCPAEADLCRWCGSSLTRMVVDPLASGCLSAWRFAVSNAVSILALVALTVAGYLLWAGGHHLLAAFPAPLRPWRPVLIGAGAVVAFAIFGYWMEFLFTCAAQTMDRSDKAPNPQTPWSLSTFAAGAKALGAVVVYVAPVFTLGLLPPALLLAATRSGGAALNPARVLRVAWRHLKDFVVLWLVLMLWTAVAGLAVLGTVLLYRLTRLLPHVQGASRVAMSMTMGAVATLVLAVIACLYGVMVF
ncbi:MAG TPA: hypothetical protein VNA25_24065, partial [Phycisphaerae bacterium]|nr:hypothetical protein [Phycisphaerae bacterium]